MLGHVHRVIKAKLAVPQFHTSRPGFLECCRLCQVIKVGLCVGIIFTYPIQAFVPFEIMWPVVEKRLQPLRYPVASELAFRSAVVFFTCT